LDGLHSSVSTEFNLLDSGDRKRYVIDQVILSHNYVIKNKDISYILNYETPTFGIVAHDSVEPKVSSDFGYIQFVHSFTAFSYPMLNIESVKYETDAKRLKYATFEVNNPTEFELIGGVRPRLDYTEEDYQKAGCQIVHFTLNPGETKSIKVPLGDYGPQDVIQVFLESQKM